MRADLSSIVKRQKGGAALLYTPEQRGRRDSSHWTLVQGILAPIQFLVFLISLFLVLRYLATGDGAAAAAVSNPAWRGCRVLHVPVWPTKAQRL